MKLTQLLLLFFSVILFSTSVIAGPPAIVGADWEESRGHLGLPWSVALIQLGVPTLEGGCMIPVGSGETIGEGKVWESVLVERAMRVTIEVCALRGIIISENITVFFYNPTNGEDIRRRTMGLIDYQLIKELAIEMSERFQDI